MSDFYNNWADKQAVLARGAQSKTSADDLTNEERIALAFCAGAKIDADWADGKMTLRSHRPLGFAKTDGKWRVYELQREGTHE